MDPAAQRIRDKLWYGLLPNVAPVKTSGVGHGSGHKRDALTRPSGPKKPSRTSR